MNSSFRRVLLVFLCSAVVTAAVLSIFKDRLAGWAIRGNFERVFPGCAFEAPRVQVSLGSLKIDRFDVTKKPRHPEAILAVGKGVFRLDLSPLGLLRDPFAALTRATLRANRAAWADFALDGLTFDMTRSPGSSFLNVRTGAAKAGIEKKAVEYLSAEGKLYRDRFLIDNINGAFCGGTFAANGELSFSKAWVTLRLHLVLKGLRMEELMKVLETEKKMDITGVYSGSIDFVLDSASGIKEISGELVSEGGGRMIVTDTAGLEAGLPAGPGANIVVENFKNYYYDIGKVVIGKTDGDIKLQIMLEGLAGSRHLDIVLHGEENGKT